MNLHFKTHFPGFTCFSLSRPGRIFGGPDTGDLASPAALAAALSQYKHVTAQLTAQLEEMRKAQAATEERFKELLAQHHDAWKADRSRQSLRHALDVARLRDLHAAHLARLATRAPATYAEAAEAAAEEAAKAALEARAAADY